MNRPQTPPVDPETSEASPQQLALAREQGDAYGRAPRYIGEQVARDAGKRRVGAYLIGYAVEGAEEMYEWADGELVWREPGQANVHVEVSVRDAGTVASCPARAFSRRSSIPTAKVRSPHRHQLTAWPLATRRRAYRETRSLPVAGCCHTSTVRLPRPTAVATAIYLPARPRA